MIIDHRDIRGAFRRLSLPLVFSMLGDQLLGAVDTIAIGAMGTTALAGATAASSAFGVVLCAVAGAMTGMSIVAAQRVGANDMEGFGNTARGSIALSTVLAVLAALASFVFAFPIMHLMLGSLPSIGDAAGYFILRCVSLLAIAVKGGVTIALGAAGNRKFAVKTLIIINIVHIPLLLIFGLGWLTHHPFGVIGAGFSSCLSEFAALAYTVSFVLRHPEFRILSSWSIDWKIAWRCFNLGLPEAIFLILAVFPDAFTVALLAPLGPTIVSALRALFVVSALTFILPTPLQMATQTVIGQRLGARDGHGAFWFFGHARRLSIWISVAMTAVVAASAWPLAYIFTLNTEVASLAAGPLALHMLSLPIRSWSVVSIAPIRASGDTRFSMFVGIWCCGLIAPLAWIGIKYWHIGLYAVPVAWIVGWGARAIVTEWKLRHSDWRSREPLYAAS